MLILTSSGASFLEKALFTAYGRLRGVPTLFAIRSGHFMDACRRSRAFRTIARLLLKIPARLLCQGEQWRRFFTTEMGIPVERCTILENWVASRDLLAVGKRRRNESANPVHILYLGWVERFKGVFELLDAVAILHADPQAPAFLLSIAGEGGETAAVRARVEEKGLSDLVRIEGLLEGERRLAALEKAHIFVLPSHTEGLPNAMIEAMATGLPVVVTPVGSIPDVVVDGTNGLLVRPHDSAALAAVPGATARVAEST